MGGGGGGDPHLKVRSPYGPTFPYKCDRGKRRVITLVFPGEGGGDARCRGIGVCGGGRGEARLIGARVYRSVRLLARRRIGFSGGRRVGAQVFLCVRWGIECRLIDFLEGEGD